MGAKRDLVAELRGYAERSSFAYDTGEPDWTRLNQILKLYGQAREDSIDETVRCELQRHIVVSLIGVIQSSVRRTIVDVLDSKETRGDPLPELRNVKLTLDLVRELKNQRFSVGELVAHFLSVSSVDQMSSALNDACGRDLSQILLDRFLDKSRPIPEGATPEESVRRSRERLLKMFYYRNIYCHEEGLGVSMKETDLYGFVVTTITLVSALEIFRAKATMIQT
jgi:hypothetical protein